MTHGTPDGFDQGCRTDVSCVNHRTHLMTCREASIRYRGDYAYQKAVDAGTATTEREVFSKPERPKVPKAPKIGSKPSSPRAKAEPRATTARPTKGIIGPDGFVHGTPSGYMRGCPDHCPAVDAGLPSCTDAAKARWRKAAAKARADRKGKARPSARHGTTSGYQQFKCRSRTDCPAVAEGRVSCGQAKADYMKSRKKAA
jgi:hypothetical protein